MISSLDEATRWISRAVCLGVALGATNASVAAQIALDTASNAAYAADSGGAWKGVSPTPDENPAGTDDGGTGFKPWIFAGGFHYPMQSPYGRLNHFIDGVDFAASSFNALGAPAFALTNANVPFGGATATATRAFEAPLAVGQTVSLKVDVPTLAPLNVLDSSGVVIRLNEGGGALAQPGVTERFAIFADSSYLSGNWAAADAAGEATLGVASSTTSAGAVFRFTLTGAETYRFDLFALNGTTTLASKTGSLAHAGTGAIDAIEVLMYSNGSGNGLNAGAAQPTGAREFFFNDLSVSSVTDADYDDNGRVDGGDFLKWQRTLGSESDLAADGSGNGMIDAADLAVWRSALTSANATLVPEPVAASLNLAFLGALGGF
jgi:hypothetical protein